MVSMRIELGVAVGVAVGVCAGEQATNIRTIANVSVRTVFIVLPRSIFTMPILEWWRTQINQGELFKKGLPLSGTRGNNSLFREIQRGVLADLGHKVA